MDGGEWSIVLLGCIADDFTGAGDLANTLARAGMRTRMVIGDGAIAAGEGDEAIVVAVKTRSVAPHDAVAQSLAALERLGAAGCRQFFFKYCSTFDSTSSGNIGPVAEALASALGVSGVVVCPAFPATGRTVYQGHLFVGDRLLSESGMERHPLTPMTDPDIRRWLGRQSARAPGHVSLGIVRQGARAIAAALAEAAAELVVVDAVEEKDLLAIGEAAAGATLVTGGSGVAMGLPANFRRAGLLGGGHAALPVFRGAALVISGSCSVATRAQVARYAAGHPAYAVSVDRLLGGEPVEREALAFVRAHRCAGPLVYSTDQPDAVAEAQVRHGAGEAAGAVETLFGRLAAACAQEGFERIVVAGGETSGAVVAALGMASLSIGAEIDPGVPALSGTGPSGAALGLALKSGNFGAVDFFERASSVLGGGDA